MAVCRAAACSDSTLVCSAADNPPPRICPAVFRSVVQPASRNSARPKFSIACVPASCFCSGDRLAIPAGPPPSARPILASTPGSFGSSPAAGAAGVASRAAGAAVVVFAWSNSVIRSSGAIWSSAADPESSNPAMSEVPQQTASARRGQPARALLLTLPQSLDQLRELIAAGGLMQRCRPRARRGTDRRRPLQRAGAERSEPLAQRLLLRRRGRRQEIQRAGRRAPARYIPGTARRSEIAGARRDARRARAEQIADPREIIIRHRFPPLRERAKQAATHRADRGAVRSEAATNRRAGRRATQDAERLIAYRRRAG